MAIGKASDFKVYDDQVYGGLWEGLSQSAAGFNEASAGTMRLVPRDRLGDYSYESFFKSIGSVVSRRDTTSVSAATDLAMTQDEVISVKVNRKFGPVAQTVDAWKKVGKDPQEMSFRLGEQMAEEVALDMVNTAVLCVEAGIEGQAAFNYDATGETTKTMTHSHMVNGFSKMGDFAGRLRTVVMHSKPGFDVTLQSIADNVFEVGGMVIRSNEVPMFNKRVVTIDAPALHDANGSLIDTYNTLALTQDAVVIEESENPPTIAFDLVTGLENLVWRFQAEYTYNVTVKGLKWDVANGGAGPTDAALGTTTNWDLNVTSFKNGAGVRVKTQ